MQMPINKQTSAARVAFPLFFTMCSMVEIDASRESEKGSRTLQWRISIYFKRVDPYLCSAKAPVLEGSGSRRLYPRKGTSVDRV